MPGSDLSQPASVTVPSSRSANTTVSTESAMTSRETSEARMPSWPIEMPSETEIVPNSIGKPPACAHALLGRLGQPVQRQVAGRDLVPRRRDADLRLVDVVVGHADGAQHGAGRGPPVALGDVRAAGLARAHVRSTSPICPEASAAGRRAHGLDRSAPTVRATLPGVERSASAPTGSHCSRCSCCCSAACPSRRPRAGCSWVLLVPRRGRGVGAAGAASSPTTRSSRSATGWAGAPSALVGGRGLRGPALRPGAAAARGGRRCP